MNSPVATLYLDPRPPMRFSPKRAILTLVVVVLLAGILFAWRTHAEHREILAEEALENLPIDAIEIKDATFEDALRMVTEKVRLLGHPDFQLRIYSDGRDVPCFHSRLDQLSPEMPGPYSLKIVSQGGISEIVHEDVTNLLPPPSPPTSVTLREVLLLISNHFHFTCKVRADALLAVRADGTMQRYRRTTVPIFSLQDDAGIHAWLKDNGIEFYEGMTFHLDREGKWLEFFGPDEQVDLLELIVTPSDFPGRATKRGIMEYRFYEWRKRTLGF